MVANLTRTTVTWGEVLLYEEQSKKKKKDLGQLNFHLFSLLCLCVMFSFIFLVFVNSKDYMHVQCMKFNTTISVISIILILPLAHPDCC